MRRCRTAGVCHLLMLLGQMRSGATMWQLGSTAYDAADGQKLSLNTTAARSRCCLCRQPAPISPCNARPLPTATLPPPACRYNEDLEGVLLSFRNMRVLTHAAVIHPYFPYVRLEVLADVVLFRPRTGTRLGAFLFEGEESDD